MLLALLGLDPAVQRSIHLANDEPDEFVLRKDVVDDARELERCLHVTRPHGLHKLVELLVGDGGGGSCCGGPTATGLAARAHVDLDGLPARQAEVDRVVAQQNGLVVP